MLPEELELPDNLSDTLSELKTAKDDYFKLATLVKSLGRFKEKEAFETAIKFLNHKDKRVCANAVEALSNINHPECIKALLPCILSPDNRIKANAAKALYLLSKSDISRDFILQELISMLKSHDINTKTSAVYILDTLALPQLPNLLKTHIKFKDFKERKLIQDVFKKYQIFPEDMPQKQRNYYIIPFIILIMASFFSYYLYTAYKETINLKTTLPSKKYSVVKKLKDAESKVRSKQYYEAILILEDLLKSNPSIKKAHELYIICCKNLSELKRAKEFYNSQLYTKPDNPYYFAGLALLSLSKGSEHKATAVNYLKKAIKFIPAQWVYSELIGLLMDFQNYKEISAILKKHKTLLRNPKISLCQARIFIKNAQYDKAVKLIEKILKFNPDFPTVFSYLAQAYYFKNNLKKASFFSDKAILSGQNLPLAYYIKGLIEFKKGNENSLLNLLRKATDSHNKEATANLHYLLARFYEKQGKLQKANYHIDRAIAILPGKNSFRMLKKLLQKF